MHRQQAIMCGICDHMTVSIPLLATRDPKSSMVCTPTPVIFKSRSGAADRCRGRTTAVVANTSNAQHVLISA